MRFVLPTRYDQGFAWFRHRGTLLLFTALVAAVAAAPLLADPWALSLLTQTAILALAGLGLMLLTGCAGCASLGHAAFLGIGAYTQATLVQAGWAPPLALPVAAGVSAIAGVAMALPTLRLAGLSLAMATLAFAEIVRVSLARAETWTHGFDGLPVPAFGWTTGARMDDRGFAFVCLVALALVLAGLRNLLRSPTGRAFHAIRDSELAAESLGVPVARTRVLAFCLSAAITGLAGGLFAHHLPHLTPESFTVVQSIELMVIVVVGGLGSLAGAVVGAAVVVAIPPLLSVLRESLPAWLARQGGLETGLYGVLLIVFVRWEPEGLMGRWHDLRRWCEHFPLGRRRAHRRQRRTLRTERLR